MVQIPIPLLWVIFHAFRAKQQVAIYASPAVFISVVDGLSAPYASAALDWGLVSSRVRRISSSEHRPVTHERLC